MISLFHDNMMATVVAATTVEKVLVLLPDSAFCMTGRIVSNCLVNGQIQFHSCKDKRAMLTSICMAMEIMPFFSSWRYSLGIARKWQKSHLHIEVLDRSTKLPITQVNITGKKIIFFSWYMDTRLKLSDYSTSLKRMKLEKLFVRGTNHHNLYFQKFIKPENLPPEDAKEV